MSQLKFSVDSPPQDEQQAEVATLPDDSNVIVFSDRNELEVLDPVYHTQNSHAIPIDAHEVKLSERSVDPGSGTHHRDHSGDISDNPTDAKATQILEEEPNYSIGSSSGTTSAYSTAGPS